MERGVAARIAARPRVWNPWGQRASNGARGGGKERRAGEMRRRCGGRASPVRAAVEGRVLPLVGRRFIEHAARIGRDSMQVAEKLPAAHPGKLPL